MSNQEMIDKSLELADFLTDLNRLSPYEEGQHTYSISIGSNGRGQNVYIHVQNERFKDILIEHPSDSYDRFKVSYLKDLPEDTYHIDYILPYQGSRVGITTIAYSFYGVLDILGQDVMEHIQISTLGISSVV